MYWIAKLKDVLKFTFEGITIYIHHYIINVVLEPVGWVGLGVATILSIGKPDYQKLIPIVAIIGAIRQRIKYESKES